MEQAVLITPTERPEVAAAKDRRLRAIHRRELQQSVRASAAIYAGCEVMATITFCLWPPHPIATALLVGIPLVLVGLGIAYAVRHRGRHHVVPLALVAGVMPFITCLSGLFLLEPFIPLFVATVGMIPIAFAVFVPLDRRAHMVWLGLALSVFFGAFLVLPRSPAIDAAIPSLGAAVGVSVLLSMLATEVQARRRAEMNKQLLAVRALYSRMQEHEMDLRRQDEFLLMQQETLVVQQAELLRLNEELETIARLDGLTGLGNRLRLNEDLVQLAGRIERSGGTAGLLLLDLDRFKRLNDSAGHLAGDAALRGVAEVLRRTSRVGDGLYRYGGEEFLVVLHDCDEAVLELAGQRYVSAIQAAGMTHPDNAPWGVVTASAGAAELSERNGLDVDAALRAADAALYQAKARGRNRLEVQACREVEIVPIDERAAS